ncbi:MAG: PhnD/SsuA/transferrin family substrate-binding protein [Acidobacteriota bacterium]
MRRAAFWLSLLVGAMCLALLLWRAPREHLLSWLLHGSDASRVPTPAASQLSPSLARRVAVGAMISPARTIQLYSALFELIGQRLGQPVAVVLKKTYREVNEALLRGEVDVAWVCTGGFLDLRQGGRVNVLVVPQVKGHTTYRSYLVVRAEAPYQRLEQLRGSRVVYSDPLSLTGYRLPRQMVQNLGFSPDEFFSQSFFSYSHDASLWAVRRSLADVAGVDSLVFDFLAEHYGEEVKGLRVLAVSPEMPIPPLVVGRWVPDSERNRWQDLLTTLHQDPQGHSVLQGLGIDRFVLPQEGMYDALP